MFANLKVRTGMILVLGLFFLAMLVSNAAGWLGMNASNTRLDEVNRIFSDQVMPSYAGYTYALRARINMNNAVSDLQEGRLRQFEEQAKRAGDALAEAAKRFEVFAKAPKSPDVEEKAAPVLAQFKSYMEVLKRLQDTVARQAIAEYMQLTPAASTQNTQFDTAMQAYTSYVDAITDVYVDEAEAAHKQSNTVTLVLVALAVLLAVGGGLFIARNVLKPLVEAGGHFDRIAGGDLTARVEVRNSNEIGQLFAALKRMQESLTRTVSTVRRGVDEINVGAREISAGNTDLSSRTEEQAASLEETAA
ncbi:chemotaxis protein, partial [Bordetella pseudohinzii]